MKKVNLLIVVFAGLFLFSGGVLADWNTSYGQNLNGINVTTYGGLYYNAFLSSKVELFNPENSNDADVTTYTNITLKGSVANDDTGGLSYLVNFTIPNNVNGLTVNFTAKMVSGNQWVTLWCRNKTSQEFVKISPTTVSAPYTVHDFNFTANNSCFNNTDIIELNLTIHNLVDNPNYVFFYDINVNYTYLVEFVPTPVLASCSGAFGSILPTISLLALIPLIIIIVIAFAKFKGEDSGMGGLFDLSNPTPIIVGIVVIIGAIIVIVSMARVCS